MNNAAEKLVNLVLDGAESNILHQFISRCMAEAWNPNSDLGATMNAKEHVVLNAIIEALENAGVVVDPAA